MTPKSSIPEQKINNEVNNNDNPTEELKLLVGDLGAFGGTFSDYNNILDDLLNVDDWSNINTLLRVNEKYVLSQADLKNCFPDDIVLKIRSKMAFGGVFYSREMLYIQDPSLKCDEQVRSQNIYPSNNFQ